MKNFEQWNGFKGNRWKEKIDVRNFIGMNYTPYDGDASFLEGPTEATNKLWGKLQALQKEERAKGGVLDMETEVVTSLTAYGPGYIDEETKDLEKVVGLQTDKPLKRAFMPYGGIKMAEQACETYGYKVSDKIKDVFHNYEFKTHNQGVFDIYTPEMKVARHNKILTGLPDTYGRGRIVGDYRRVALYGIDALIEGKQKDFAACDRQGMRRYDFQLREEIADQIRALKGMKVMAESYGYDISKPAKDAREAFQWLYFGYLAAIKTQNGAAMSVGRISTFLDIYIERDLKNGVITETEAQELIDQFIIKLRLTRHLRTPEYDELFGGDPTWITESISGVGINGKPLVTKNSFRYLHTLYNIGTAPEPNLTVLWSEKLPDNFKHFCSKVSIDTDSIQYENDDVLDFDKVWENYKKVMTYVAELYVDTVNIIHFMHDKYAYEASQFALHDTNLERIAAYGIAGLSIAADSLSAIKYATVKPIRNENGALASLNSVAKIPYRDVCQDGVSNTFSIVPDALGKDQEQRVQNLTTILDGYFVQGAHHLNVNVMHRETLIDAMEHPEKYPTLTIRVSGYAVNFNRLSREQQEEVIRRTFHQSM